MLDMIALMETRAADFVEAEDSHGEMRLTLPNDRRKSMIWSDDRSDPGKSNEIPRLRYCRRNRRRTEAGTFIAVAIAVVVTVIGHRFEMIHKKGPVFADRQAVYKPSGFVAAPCDASTGRGKDINFDKLPKARGPHRYDNRIEDSIVYL